MSNNVPIMTYFPMDKKNKENLFSTLIAREIILHNTNESFTLIILFDILKFLLLGFSYVISYIVYL